jgi:hypothetical protein
LIEAANHVHRVASGIRSKTQAYLRLSLDERIGAFCSAFEEAVGLVDIMPGIACQMANFMVTEIGTAICRAPTANHLAALAQS